MQDDQRRQNPNPGAILVLAGVAVLSVLLYLLAFVYPYNIFELYPYPRLAVYRFAQDDPMVIWWLTIAFVIQYGLYFLGWRTAQQARGRTAWLIVLGGALASGLVLLFLYPFDAADVFDHIMRGRILSVYGGNPFQDVAAQFPDDPFYAYAAWRHVPSSYGPGWELLTAGITSLAGDGLIANVLAFKVVEGIFLTASIGLVFLILRRAAPERSLAGVTLLAWNPLILYETLGNAHNDSVIIFMMLATVLALLYRRYTLAILALVLGGLFKFIPLLLLPAAGLMVLRSLPNNRARLRFLVITTLFAGVLIVPAYAPFWYGPGILKTVSQRSQLFTASLPAAVYTWLLPTLGKAQAASIVSRTTTSATILFILWQSWRAWSKPTWLTFSQVGVNILLFYLLLACTWFQQWYTLWPLALAVLLPPGPSVYLTLILGGYTLLAKHVIFGPLIYRLHPFPREWREIWFGPTVLGVPWLYAFFALIDGFARKIFGTAEARG